MFKRLSGDALITEMQCLRGHWVLGKRERIETDRNHVNGDRQETGIW